MPQNKLTIVPVTLHSENKITTAAGPVVSSSIPSCTIRTSNAEISFYNGVDEHIIQTVMRGLRDQ
jgi:hypothetical protein